MPFSRLRGNEGKLRETVCGRFLVCATILKKTVVEFLEGRSIMLTASSAWRITEVRSR